MKKDIEKTQLGLHYLIARLDPKHRLVLSLLSHQIDNQEGVAWPRYGESIQQCLSHDSIYCYSHITKAVRELQYQGLLRPVLKRDDHGKYIRGFELVGWKRKAYDHWAVQQLLSNPDKGCDERDASWNDHLSLLEGVE